VGEDVHVKQTEAAFISNKVCYLTVFIIHIIGILHFKQKKQKTTVKVADYFENSYLPSVLWCKKT
jgi:hypothetical protein